MSSAHLGVHDLRAQLRTGALTSVALAHELIERTNAQRHLHGYVVFDEEKLLKQAADADARLAAGVDLPLLGVPVALKDNIDSVDFPSSAGTESLMGAVPVTDADLTLRLRAAGALIAGKANMHELAFGITTDNHATGQARNPWDSERIPGGSSGGSGVVVAAGIVPAAVGTDTGGSVRVPAALCGLVGLRPTVGRVSGKGIAPISTTRDTAGPMARSVADCALLDSVLTGSSAALPMVSLAGLRLGIPENLFWEDLDPGVRSVAESAVERLRVAGAHLVSVALPTVSELNAGAGFPIALYEFVRDMKDYLYYAKRGVTIEELVARIKSPDVKGIVTPLLEDGAISASGYRHALSTRTLLQEMYAQAFMTAGVQALVFPTTPVVATKTSEKTEVVLNGKAQPLFPTFIRNTDPGSNAGLPGLTLPVGLSEGLPVGLSLDGLPGSDRFLLALGVEIEKLFPAVSAPWMR
jgi:Asp-tRNA(Asn)/Glu-tRNA(Gln) amidotransferase A subunit family amidase